MPIVKYVDADADRILLAVKSALFDQASESVRIIKLETYEVPPPPEQASFIEVHPDGLVELWGFDGERHHMLMACIEPREGRPTPDLDLTLDAPAWLSFSGPSSSETVVARPPRL